MSRPLAARIALIEPFLAMEVMERAFAIERAGGKVLHLEIGEPDFPPPPAAVEACMAALREGETRYTDSRGLFELREAIAADLARRFAVKVDPERVIVTSGTSPAMLLVFSLLVDPGDEVVIGTPHYPCYPSFVRVCGGVPVFVPTDPARGYPLDPDAVRAAVTPRTRAIVVGSPANPTGAVQSAETLRAIAALGVPLVSDEIYDGLVYSAVGVTSALEISEDAYVLDGFSKRYAMTGFRLGWLVAPPERVRPLQILSQNLFISANRFVQRAGIAALAHGGETVRAMRDAYARRRDRMVTGLRALGFGVPHVPDGAFYVFADARAFGSDSRALAFELLERAHVGTTPGVDFGAAGEGWLRFSYAASDATIEEALARLAGALPSRKRPKAARRSAPRITTAELFASAASPAGFPAPGPPEIAFLGRSNVGKSSLLNALVGRRALARTSSTPGKTRLLNWFRVVRGEREVWLVDLPGYGWAKVSKAERAQWKRWIEAYLGDRPTLRLAVLLQDLRRDPGPDEALLLQWLAERDVPTLVALTKCDKLKPMRRAERVRVLGKSPELPAGQILATSAETGLGIPELWAVIDRVH